MSDKNFKIKNGLDANGAVTITQPSTSTVPLTILANTLATGSNLLEVKRPDGTVRFAVGNDGALTVNSNISFNGGSMSMYPGNSGQTALSVFGQTNQSVANLIVRAATGQSGNVQEWRDQNNNVAARIGPDFAFRSISGGFFGTATGNIVGTNYLGVRGWAEGHIPFVVQGVASQTGDLTRWVDSSANTLAKVDASGSISAVDLTLSGNLTVNGTTTNLNSTNLIIEDKNIIIADVATPTDTTADGAGITIKGATDKTLNWVQSTGSFTSSEPFIINTTSTTKQNLIIKAIASQTSNLTEWQDSTGYLISRVDSGGSHWINASPATSGSVETSSAYLYLTSNRWTGSASSAEVFGINNFRFGGAGAVGAFALHLKPSYSANAYLSIAGDSSRSVGVNVQYPSASSGYGQFGVQIQDASYKGVVVKAAASQTANLQEWQNSAGTVLASLGSSGVFTSAKDVWHLSTDSRQRLLYAGDGASIYKTYTSHDWRNASDVLTNRFDANGGQQNLIQAATTVGLIVKGAASQTANLQEWQNSAGTVLSSVGPNGTVTMKSVNSANIATFYNGTSGYGAGSISANGTFYINAANMGFPYTSSGATLSVNATSATSVPITSRGYTSQTANLQEWQNSDSVAVAQISATGTISTKPVGFSGNLNTAIISVTDRGSTWAPGNFAFRSDSGGIPRFSFTAPNASSEALTINGNWIGVQTPNPTATFQVTSISATHIGSIIKGAASQSANIQEWQNSAGTVLGKISSDGGMTLGGANGSKFQVDQFGTLSLGSYRSSSPTFLYVNSQFATDIGAVIRGHASQSASLQEWQDSTGTVLGKVDSAGHLNFLSKIIYANQMYVGTGNYLTATMHNTSGGAGEMRLLLRAHPSQTASIQEWQNSAGTALAKIDALGNFTAISKSFDIIHPTKENMRLRYGSLEGPENGVYIRGTIESNVIELPDYWTGLVHEDSITVSLTSVGSAQNIYVEKIENNKVYIGGELTKAFFTVYGERKDIDKLTVEY